VESTLLATPHPVMIPTNTYDLIWIVSTALILILLGIIALFMKRLLEKIDCMSTSINKLSTSEAITKTELMAHIGNEGVHCKGSDCLYNRRATDVP
jgi:hypothetical protein